MATFDDWYTPRAAQEKLGVQIWELKRLADKGILKRIVPPGKSRAGLYHKPEVDALAEEMRAFNQRHRVIA